MTETEELKKEIKKLKEEIKILRISLESRRPVQAIGLLRDMPVTQFDHEDVQAIERGI